MAAQRPSDIPLFGELENSICIGGFALTKRDLENEVRLREDVHATSSYLTSPPFSRE